VTVVVALIVSFSFKEDSIRHRDRVFDWIRLFWVAELRHTRLLEPVVPKPEPSGWVCVFLTDIGRFFRNPMTSALCIL
jgi:hypothetical protein